MIITKYNAICNLGDNIDEVFSKASANDTTCFETRDFARLGVIKTNLEEISDPDYNIRANQLILKTLEPLSVEILDKEKTAIVVATTNSGVEEYETSKNPKHFEIGNSAEFVHKYFGFKNFYTAVSTACSSGVKAFAIAKKLLENNIAENVIVIGVDTLAKLPIYGFNSLEILSPEPTKPFQPDRKGINIGEGCAAFLVQNEGEGIEVTGIGETTDFYHSTSPDPEGVEAQRAVELALGVTEPEKIDYINYHGTGTIANDDMETKIIKNIFGENVPATSTKPFTGHCLGAAACIETALCCKLLEKGYAKGFNLKEGTKVKTCLSTSFGFGGTNCAIILQRRL